MKYTLSEIIKRHIGAFIAMVGFVLCGAGFLLVFFEGFAINALGGFLSVLGCAVVLAGFIIGCVRFFKGKRRLDGLDEISPALRNYAFRRPGVSVYSVWTILASPLLPFLLIWQLDYYAVGLMVAGLGLAIWHSFCSRDVIASLLYKSYDTEKVFDIAEVTDEAEAEALYNSFSPIVRMSRHKQFLDLAYSVAYHERALPKGRIPCRILPARVWTAAAGEEYCEDTPQDDYMVLKPSDFILTRKNALHVLSVLSAAADGQYYELISRRRYGKKDSLAPEDYVNAGDTRAIPTRLLDKKVSEQRHGDLYLAFRELSGCGAHPHMTYYDCLMVLRGAVVLEEAENEETFNCANPTWYGRARLEPSQEHSLVLTLMYTNDYDEDYEYDYENMDDEPESWENVQRFGCSSVAWYYDGERDGSEEVAFRELSDPCSPTTE